MIIPYGHEHTTVRRLPWVTFVLMGLCVMVFVITAMSSRDTESRVAEDFNEFFVYLTSHPYLELDPEFERQLYQFIPKHELEAFLEASRELGRERPSHPGQIQHEQQELDRIVRRLSAVLDGVRQSPYHRFGLVPADLQPHAVITYQFLHGGFLHLFGNLFFLFLAGPFIEDVWGRPVFAVFYLSAGAIAGLMFAVRYPQLDGPLIGASGAVAGVMGAFLVRYWKTKIKFMYFFFPFRPGTFAAPAWLMLPLWFARELVFAQAWDVVSPGAGGGGVAHWAHVWGFAFGLAVAGAISYWKIEDRFIHHAIESKVTVVDNSALEAAFEARGSGQIERAIELLTEVVEREPHNVDAVVALWNAALDAGRPERAAPHLLGVLRTAARSHEPALVLTHWEELIAAVPTIEVDVGLASKMAEILLRDGRRDGAMATIELAAKGVGSETAIGPLIRLLRTADSVSAPATAALAREALGRDDTPLELRADLEAIASTATEPPIDRTRHPDAGEPEEPAEVVAVEHGLQVMEAVPRSLDGSTLMISVNGASRRLSLRQVQAVAVAGVARAGKRPVVIVDLMLDAPWSDRQDLRVVRLLSTGFDPRSLVSGNDVQEAFRALLAEILELSGAAPLPDPDAARGRPFKTYGSLTEYHHRVLGVD
jgi:membrane associated rhomboid family serine protease